MGGLKAFDTLPAFPKHQGDHCDPFVAAGNPAPRERGANFSERSGSYLGLMHANVRVITPGRGDFPRMIELQKPTAQKHFQHKGTLP